MKKWVKFLFLFIVSFLLASSPIESVKASETNSIVRKIAYRYTKVTSSNLVSVNTLLNTNERYVDITSNLEGHELFISNSEGTYYAGLLNDKSLEATNEGASFSVCKSGENYGLKLGDKFIGFKASYLNDLLSYDSFDSRHCKVNIRLFKEGHIGIYFNAFSKVLNYYHNSFTLRSDIESTGKIDIKVNEVEIRDNTFLLMIGFSEKLSGDRLEVIINNKSRSFNEFESDGVYKYIVINLGDVMNNLERCTYAIEVKLFNGALIEDNKIFSLFDLVKEYYLTLGIVDVEDFYHFLNLRSL